jgi:hypothetical protein
MKTGEDEIRLVGDSVRAVHPRKLAVRHGDDAQSSFNSATNSCASCRRSSSSDLVSVALTRGRGAASPQIADQALGSRRRVLVSQFDPRRSTKPENRRRKATYASSATR